MNNPDVQADIIPANPAARRWLLFLVVIAAVAASLYFVYLSGEIERVETAENPDISGLSSQLYWMSLGLVAGATGFCVYLIVGALRTFASGEFPPPGSRVISDTRIRRGALARFIGLLNIIAGLVLLLAAFYVYWLISRYLGIETLF